MAALNAGTIEKMLEQFDGYIVGLAWKNIPMSLFQTEVIDLEVDELIQRVRIKLWKALEKQPIEHIKSYIRYIVRSEVVDLFRRHKAALPLPTDEEGEMNQEKVTVTNLEYSQRMQDPLYETLQEEDLNECVEKVSEAVCKLPPRQNYALLCALKDKVEDCFQLVGALKERGYDVDRANWPEKPKDQALLRASLAVSRKKLRSIIDT